MTKVGDRIGAMRSADGKTAHIFGYGVYAGDEIPPAGVFMMGIEMRELNCPNPKLVLDNGDVVFGCECWWGPEKAMKRRCEGMQVVMASIKDYREESAANLKRLREGLEDGKL